MPNLDNAQKNVKKARVIGRPIQKGQILNPGGRPRIPEDIKILARAASKEAIETLISIMGKEDAKDSDRLKASELILNRAWGTPAQSVEVSGADGVPLAIRLIKASDED